MFIKFILYVYILVFDLILCIIVKMVEQRSLEEPYFAIFYHNHFQCSEDFFVLFVEALVKHFFGFSDLKKENLFLWKMKKAK